MVTLITDNNIPKIFRSGDDTHDITRGVQEINARAKELLNNRGQSLYIGPYMIGFPPDAVRRLRTILDSTYP